jgi:uncharacterized protein
VALLIDGHCHQVLAADLDRPGFEAACTEADQPPPQGLSYVDSQVGLAVRRWCAPVLDLPAHAGIDEYLERRNALGWRTVTSRLLRAAGLTTLLVDTGLAGSLLLAPGEFASLTGVAVREVVRLETVAEALHGQTDAAGFADAYAAALAERVRGAVATKSIIAYRHGLDVPPERPSAAAVRRAAGEWLRGGRRLTDPVLLRHVLWAGVDTGLPLQLHTGFGDRDLRLAHADPTLAQPLLAAIEPTGVPVILLHCYPYHRQAGWLALVYPHVYVDVGLTVTHLGARATDVLAEYFELAPFGKVLFSTDAYLLPELFLVGAAQFRRALHGMLDRWLVDGALSAADAERLTAQVCADNALAVYPDLRDRS